MKEYLTVCPRNCYSTCSFRVQVEKNSIKRILPYTGNRATPEGPCIKGLSYIERSATSKRILHPLLRQQNGSFRQINMDEALSIAADKLINLKNKYGPWSILWYRGSGMAGLTNEIGVSFWRLFGGATITYGNPCWPAGLEAVRLTLGTVRHSVPWDLENAGAVIVWGKNPAETNIQEMAFISRARDKGSKIIVIDPRRTATADKADWLITPKPATDGALALAIARVLIEENLTDDIFIKKYVIGYEEFNKSLEITPEEGEKITGIPKESIILLAGIIGRTKPVTFLPGYGLQRHYNGGQTIRAILALAVMTGNIGKPGAGFNYANLQSLIFDDPKEPLSYYPDPEKDKPFRRTISAAKAGKDISGTSDPEIRCAWIERGNPVLQVPDSGSLTQAMQKLDFVVVVDQFITDTAKLADLIIPAKNMFEQSDIICSYWSPYVQLKPGILEPPGEVIPESEIYYRLAKLLKLNTDTLNFPEPGEENIKKWLKLKLSSSGSAMRFEDLEKGPVIPDNLQMVAYEDMNFETPSGKIEILSKNAAKLWNVSPIPDFKIRKDHDDNFPLTLITPNTGSRIHSQFGNLEIIEKTAEPPALEISVPDAASRQIVSGDKVRIFNNIGEFNSIARISKRIQPGCVAIPNGIWFNEGGGSNKLINSSPTDMGFGVAFHDTMVEVEKSD
jgi:anaerobic selenocysteine-containing dehydrogenase